VVIHRIDNNTSVNTVRAPGPLEQWLSGAAIVAAAGLAGFGIVLWIAANWEVMGKWGRFGLAGGAIALSALLSTAWKPGRAGGALCGILGIGGLLALTGQTYQTGADPWQLFALWAALGLPWAIAARHDAVWTLWVAVASTAIPLWGHSELGTDFLRIPSAALPMWLASIGMCVLLSPATGLERWIGATKWAFRLAVLLTLALITTTAIAALFTVSGTSLVYLLALLVVGAVCAAFALVTPFDLPLLAAAALALDALLICGFSKTILFSGNTIGGTLLIGLVSAGIVAASAVALLRIAAFRRGGGATADASSAAQQPKPSFATAEAGRNWPVAVLSGIGALMAAGPLLSFVFLLLGPVIERGIGTWLVGLAVLAGTVPWLRVAKPLGFGQQLGVIALAVGGILMGFASYRDLGVASASLVMAALAGALAAAVPIAWVRGLLGAAAAAFTSVLIAQTIDNVRHIPDVAAFRLAWVLIAAAAAGALILVPREREDAAAFAVGWSALTLLGLMLAAGQTFLVGAHLGLGGPTLGTQVGMAALWNVNRILSVAAAIGGAWLLLDRHRDLQGPAGYGAAATSVILSAFMPSLGATVLLLAAAVSTGHRVIGLVAAIAGLWIVGSFYYWLGWPLTHKAYLLIGLGLGLGLVCWLSGLRTPELQLASSRTSAWPSSVAAGLVTISVAATAAMVGTGVRSMEHILTTGRIVHIPLAPVDPRSLIQGDYMALRFALPSSPAAQQAMRARVPAMYAIASLDPRGAATVSALTETFSPAGPDRILIALAWRGGRWALGTDAYYFREGTADRYARARFGTFRVDAKGRALLIGLASERMEPLL
jgi:uncharacterized membrane-anchored protein